MIEIYINDKKYEVEEGKKLLEVCKENQIFVPSLCYHPELEAFGGCRLCLVEVRKGQRSRLVSSCEYPIRKTEHFYTDSEIVKNTRRMTAQMLISRAPDAQEVIEKALGETFDFIFKPKKVDNTKCILCGLCFRVCFQQGTAAISFAGRGAAKVITTPYKESNEACIGCGSCAAVCPTDAIAISEGKDFRAIWRYKHELLECPICGKNHITERMVEYMLKKTDLPKEEILICPDCKKEKIVKGMMVGIEK